jgi:arylformamidase
MNALYRGMDRASLDAAYNNVNAEPHHPEIMARFAQESEAVYRGVGVAKDRCYGLGKRQRFDWLPSGRPNSPTFVFIHGGYWQHHTKEDFAFVARGPLAQGFNVVLAEYTLAPCASMDHIVGDIALLIDFLQIQSDEVGFHDRPVVLCGHSAGGHLAALHRDHRAVTLSASVSGLFDLEPIALSWLNEKLLLSKRQVSAYSPSHAKRGAKPSLISVGSAELPELIRQSEDYVRDRKQLGEACELLRVDAATHFSILDDLANPNGRHLSAIMALMDAQASSTP